jgi:hypothetical protein
MVTHAHGKGEGDRRRSSVWANWNSKQENGPFKGHNIIAHLNSEDERSTFLQMVNICLHDYMVSQPRRSYIKYHEADCGHAEEM